MEPAERKTPATRALRLFGDIRFWLVLAFLVRLFGISNAPLETSHHWRQTTVLMVARNFSEEGIDLLHPRMDTAGELTGITGMEFPLLNALIALCMDLFGNGYWYARLIVLVVSCVGVFAFHALVARRCGDRAAFHAAMLLLVSLWFMYSRKAMPDVFSLSLVLVGIERSEAALSSKRPWPLMFMGILCIAIGVLSKLTSGCLLMIWPVLVYSSVSARRWQWCATGLVALACFPAVWWYFLWVPHLVETFGYWHFFMGKPMGTGALELVRNWARTLDNFYFDALRYSGFGAFLMGIGYAVKRRHTGLVATFVLLSCAFLLVMVKAGDTFWIHAYYVLPFVPVMALLGGYGLANLPDQRWAMGLLAVVALEGLAAQANDFVLNRSLAPLLSLEQDLDRSGRVDPIVINSAQVPTPMYFAHRRGWTLTNADITRTGVLDSLTAIGCRRVVIMKRSFEGDVTVPWPVLFEGPDYRIHGPQQAP